MPTDNGFDAIWGPAERTPLRVAAPTLAFLGLDPNAGAFDKNTGLWDFGDGSPGAGAHAPIADWAPPTQPPGPDGKGGWMPGMPNPVTTPTPPPPPPPTFTNPATRPTAPPPPPTATNPAVRSPTLPPATRPPGTPTPQPQSWQELLAAIFGGNAADNENRAFQRSGLDPRLDAAFNFALQEAMRRYGDPNGRNFFDGRPQVAPLTPEEREAQQLLRSRIPGAQNLADISGKFLGDTLSRTPGQNPEVDALVEATLRDMGRATTDPDGVFSKIRGVGIQNGNLGGTRQGVMEAVAGGRLADAMGKTSADIRLQARNQDQQNQVNVLNSSKNITDLMTNPASWLSGIGAQNRGQNQSEIDASLRSWLFNNQEGDRRLSNLFSMIGAAPLGGWQSGQTWMSPAQLEALRQSGYRPNSNMQNFLGGAAGLAGLWQIFGPDLMSMFGS